MSDKIFDPDSRVSKELELLAREDLNRRRVTKDKKDKFMFEWTS